jgi:hypothetical protein
MGSRTPKIQTQLGLVALFDVLGYRALLRHNQTRRAASIVMEHLVRDKSYVRRAFLMRDVVKSRKFNRRRTAHWFVISDSILLTQAIDLKRRQLRVFDSWMPFLFNCMTLMQEMFWKGLPLRGAIAFGEFYVDSERHCVVGRPIVEAYELSQSQDWSGCALTPNAVLDLRRSLLLHKYKSNTAGRYFLNALTPVYEVPMRDGQTRKLRVLNWNSCLCTRGWQIENKKQVLWSFGAFKKRIPRHAARKAENTFRFLEYAERVTPYELRTHVWRRR